MNVQKIEKAARNRLSEKRFRHTKGVADCAKKLADRYHADPDLAVAAGYLHDMEKEASLDQMLELTKNLDLDEMTKSSRSLLHGPAGAEFARKEFDIDDAIYDACFYHTTGKAGMTLLDKIICLADYMEPSRNFEGVEEIRALAETDLDLALVKGLDSTISFLIQKGQMIHPNTILARNDLLANKV